MLSAPGVLENVVKKGDMSPVDDCSLGAHGLTSKIP